MVLGLQEAQVIALVVLVIALIFLVWRRQTTRGAPPLTPSRLEGQQGSESLAQDLEGALPMAEPQGQREDLA